MATLEKRARLQVLLLSSLCALLLHKDALSFPELPFYFPEVPFSFLKFTFCFPEVAFYFSKMPYCFQNFPLVSLKLLVFLITLKPLHGVRFLCILFNF